MTAIRVFISYSHDSPEHLQRVLDLSDNLRKDGIDCHIDQYEVNPPEGWLGWMERQFDEARFVLVVFTDNYLRRYRGEEKPGSGLGAAWESMLTKDYLYNHLSVNDKFVPVVFSHEDMRSIPAPLSQTNCFRLDTSTGYLDLFRRLLGISPAEKPPLGDLKRQHRLKPLQILERQPTFIFYSKDRVHYPAATRSRAPKSISQAHQSNLPTGKAFLGRTQELSTILGAIGNNARVVAASGPVGVGKSSLILRAAKELQKIGSFRLIVWLPVEYDGLTYDDFLDTVARTLQYPYPINLRPQDKTRELNRALEGKKALLVIPNFDRIHDPRITEYCRLIPASCQLLVSTCDQAASGYVVVPVGPLNDDDASSLTVRELQRSGAETRTQIDGSLIDGICAASSNNPLAIEWAAGLVIAKNSVTDLWRTSPTSPSFDPVDYVFKGVWASLPESSRLVLLATSLFPDSATLEALAAVTQLPELETDPTLNQLVAWRLLSLDELRGSSVRAYRAHRGMIARVRKLRSTLEPVAGALLSRLVTYFLGVVKQKGGLDKDKYLDELALDRLNILGMMSHCERLGRLPEFVAFHRHTYHMLWARGFWNQNVTNGQAAASFARSVNDLESAAWIHMESLGWTHFCQGSYPEANREYLEAERLIGGLPHPGTEVKARLYNYLGRLRMAEGQYPDAIHVLWRGLRLSENDLTTTFLESALGDAYVAQHDIESAIAHYSTALLYREKSDDSFRSCSTRCDIAELSLGIGDTVRARAEFQRSLRDADAVKRLDIAARCQYGLGELNRAAGETDEATKHFKAAVEAFDLLGMDREVDRTKALLGSVSVSVPIGTQSSLSADASAVDIMLVNSPREATGSHDQSCQDFRPPIGLLNISSFLTQRGLKTAIVDAEAMSLGIAGIAQKAKQHRPKIIGLNCHTLNRHVVYEIAKTLRSLLPDSLIVLGGTHPSLAPQLTMRECDAIDAIVVGEGERVLYELCRRTAELGAIPGIWFRRNGSILRSEGDMPRIQNLDILGDVDLEQLPMLRYLNYEETALPGLWRRAYINASRGCRFKCSYCTEQSFWTGLTTFRTAGSVIREITQYRERFGVNRFYFYDDTLTDWPELAEFCKMAERIGTLWSCSTRIDRIDVGLLDMLARGGCREIAFGLESGSERSLRMVKKGWQSKCSHEEVGSRIRACSERGIVPRAHFMIGFPWEDRQDITETVQFAVNLKDCSLSDANFFVVKVYPGTQFTENIRQIQAKLALSDEEVFNAWSVFDWHGTRNPKVAAKLRRFNDIPQISLNPHCDSLTLRRLARNAYEIFFDDADINSVEQRLWSGIAWETLADSNESPV